MNAPVILITTVAVLSTTGPILLLVTVTLYFHAAGDSCPELTIETDARVGLELESHQHSPIYTGKYPSFAGFQVNDLDGVFESNVIVLVIEDFHLTAFAKSAVPDVSE